MSVAISLPRVSLLLVLFALLGQTGADAAPFSGKIRKGKPLKIVKHGKDYPVSAFRKKNFDRSKIRKNVRTLRQRVTRRFRPDTRPLIKVLTKTFAIKDLKSFQRGGIGDGYVRIAEKVQDKTSGNRKRARKRKVSALWYSPTKFSLIIETKTMTRPKILSGPWKTTRTRRKEVGFNKAMRAGFDLSPISKKLAALKK